MKNYKSLLLSIVIIINTSFASTQLIDKITAIVNNDIILESDINNLLKSLKFNANKSGQQLPDEITLYNYILEHLIMDQIILQISQKIGLRISDKQLDQEIVNIAKQNKITIKQMYQDLVHNGISYKDYRNQILKNLLISEVINHEVRQRIHITQQEIDSLTREISNNNKGNIELNLNGIFIPLKMSAPNEIARIESRIKSVVNYARNQESSFNKLKHMYFLNQKVLMCPYMGWRHFQNLPLIFVQELSRAKKGDIIGPIRSTIGFYVLKVNDIRIQKHSFCMTELHIRHILIKESPLITNDQAQIKLEQISTDIKNGKITFAKAAEKFSEDINSANHGGDLGWLTNNMYDPIIQELLICLNKCQLGAPIHTSFGWHLIQLLDTRKVDRINEMQKDQAYKTLFYHKFQEEVRIWLQEQRANAFVKILNFK